MGHHDDALAPAALLVLALWHEPSGAWRVRATRSTDLTGAEPERSYVGTRADLLRVVGEWFDAAVTPR